MSQKKPAQTDEEHLEADNRAAAEEQEDKGPILDGCTKTSKKKKQQHGAVVVLYRARLIFLDSPKSSY